MAVIEPAVTVGEGHSEKDAIEMQLNQDIENFHMTLRSLSDIGFDTEEIDNIFKLLVG